MHGTDHYVRQILAVLRADPEATPLVWRDEPVPAGELADSVLSAAEGLRQQGIGRGDVVAVLTDANTPPTLVLRYAANLLGAAVVHLRGVNAAFPKDELAEDDQFRLLEEAQAAALAVDRVNLDRAKALCARLAEPPVLVGLEPGTGVDLSAFPADAFDPADAQEGETAVVTYTSGSTGRPKGVCWSFPVRNERAATLGRAGKWECYLITAPLTHTSSHLADATLVAGGTVVLMPGFEPAAVLRAVADHHVTHLTLAAPQLYRIVEHPGLADADLSSLRELFYTGSAVASGRLSAALDAFGPILTQIYGTSETGLISRMTPSDHQDPSLFGTVGSPVPGVRVTVRDPEDGRVLPAGEAGEVCVTSPWTMAGYWRDDELTARTVHDGRVHTGDIGRLDERGYLTLLGRKAEVIKANGIKIYPASVEETLLAHPAVSQAAVFGVADADRVERICAAVVPRDGAAADAEALRAHVRTTLSANHVPSEIETRAELPFLGPGKPDRVRLREETRDRLSLADRAWQAV